MELPRRRFLHLAAGAMLPFASRIARAQAYPSRPARIIVPYPAGGFADISARLVAGNSSDICGKAIIWMALLTMVPTLF
jgi:tripartite-type tricarboxylate transporter receptor subunit TctC